MQGPCLRVFNSPQARRIPSTIPAIPMLCPNVPQDSPRLLAGSLVFPPPALPSVLSSQLVPQPDPSAVPSSPPLSQALSRLLLLLTASHLQPRQGAFLLPQLRHARMSPLTPSSHNSSRSAALLTSLPWPRGRASRAPGSEGAGPPHLRPQSSGAAGPSGRGGKRSPNGLPSQCLTRNRPPFLLRLDPGRLQDSHFLPLPYFFLNTYYVPGAVLRAVHVAVNKKQKSLAWRS